MTKEIDFPASCPACELSTDDRLGMGIWEGPSYVEVGRAFTCRRCHTVILWLDRDDADAPTRLLRHLPRWGPQR